jgi:ribonuclease P protein component
MLPPANRLLKEKDFRNVFKKGGRLFGKDVGIKFIKNKLALNRFGIIIGLKISKKSTERNQLKRKIKAVIKKLKNKIKKGHDIIIIPKPTLLQLNSKEISRQIEDNLRRLGLLK